MRNLSLSTTFLSVCPSVTKLFVLKSPSAVLNSPRETKSRLAGQLCRPSTGVNRASLALIEAMNGLKKFADRDRKSTRLNSSHANISYAVFCLKKKKKKKQQIVHTLKQIKKQS